jgi:hypothetical protein
VYAGKRGDNERETNSSLKMKQDQELVMRVADRDRFRGPVPTYSFAKDALLIKRNRQAKKGRHKRGETRGRLNKMQRIKRGKIKEREVNSPVKGTQKKEEAIKIHRQRDRQKDRRTNCLLAQRILNTRIILLCTLW